MKPALLPVGTESTATEYRPLKGERSGQLFRIDTDQPIYGGMAIVVVRTGEGSRLIVTARPSLSNSQPDDEQARADARREQERAGAARHLSRTGANRPMEERRADALATRDQAPRRRFPRPA